ncbi:MAG: hypothetical protein WC975_00275 [Phycisphaerae bacterium]
MNTKNLKAFLLILVVVLLIDWFLGAAGLHKLFLLANIPFGVANVWFESHWVGTHYEVSGRTVGENWAFLIFFGTIFAQSCFYFLLWSIWHKRRTVRRETA